MWVEMITKTNKSGGQMSSSSWGCELKYNSSATRYNGNNVDIVNIGWHIYLKDITAYAASPRDS